MKRALVQTDDKTLHDLLGQQFKIAQISNFVIIE
jgi:hypothetical protein